MNGILLPFIVGSRVIAPGMGVSDSADQNLIGALTALGGGLKPVSVLLATQLARQRAAPASPATATPSPAPPAAGSAAPVANFDHAIKDLEVRVVDRSTGVIRRRRWAFDDGCTSSDAVVVRRYAAAGTYEVELTVYGDSGSSSTTKRQITVGATVPPPAPSTSTTPVQADFEYSADALKVNFTDRSTGLVKTRAWTLGDGNTSAQVDPEHTYKQGGSFHVELSVSDEAGVSNATTRPVVVKDPSSGTAPAPAATPGAGKKTP